MSHSVVPPMIYILRNGVNECNVMVGDGCHDVHEALATHRCSVCFWDFFFSLYKLGWSSMGGDAYNIHFVNDHVIILAAHFQHLTTLSFIYATCHLDLIRVILWAGGKGSLRYLL